MTTVGFDRNSNLIAYIAWKYTLHTIIKYPIIQNFNKYKNRGSNF